MTSMPEREHAVDVGGHEGDLGGLAIEVGRLRYDALSFFLAKLAEELARQAAGDRQRGRTKLAARLDELVASVAASAEGSRTVWQICRPHSAWDLERHPEIEC